MMNNQTPNWSNTGADWISQFALKVRYLLQCSSCASPYKGRQTGVEQTDPAWNALAKVRITLVSPSRGRYSPAPFLTLARRCLPGVAARVIQRVLVLGRYCMTRSQSLTSGLPIESSGRIGPTLAPTHTQAPDNLLNSCAQSASGQRFAYPLHRSEGFSRALSQDLQHSGKHRVASADRCQAKRLRW
jgi:hypothetical protein